MRKPRPLPYSPICFEELEPRLLLSVPATFDPSGMGGGGWFGPTSINPYNHNEIWMPTDMGELFHSTDGGATWTFSTTIGEGYCSPVQFTGSSSVMWAIDADGGGHPSKSTDGGNTWSDASSWSSSLGRANFLYTDPNRTSSFIVCSTINNSGTDNRVYLSKDGGATWGSPVYVGNPGTNSSGTPLELVVSGLFKDGSNVWIPTSQGILYSSNNGGSFGMLAVPWNSSTEAASSVAISRSGDTIRFVATTVDPAALTLSNYFEWSSSAKNVYLSDFTVSTNSQGAWTTITSRLSAGKLEGFAAMAQGNISTIYLGGEDSHDAAPSVLKSTDNGLTWNETFQYVNNANIATNQNGYKGSDYPYAWGGYAYSLQVCLNDVDLVTISNIGTAYMTTDGGAGGANTTASNADWRDITVAPQYLHAPGTVALAGTTPYAGTADNTAAYNLVFLSSTNIFAAMTDNTGLYSYDGGASWYYPTYNSNAFFGNFFDVTVDYRNGVMYAAAGFWDDIFKGGRLTNSNRDERGGGLDYSTDGGKTWSLLAQWSNPDGTTNPLTRVVLDPNTIGRAYALVANSTNGGIWRTDNLYLADGKTVNPNATWTQLAVPSRYLNAFTYSGDSQHYAAGTYYAHDPNDLKILNDGTLVAVFDEQYDSTDSHADPSSGVWVSTDGGSSWTDRSDLNLAQSNMMFYSQRICIDPQDPAQNTWYVAADFSWSDYLQNNYGVFESIDRGAHWAHIFTGITPDESGLGCDNVTINADTGEMYLSTSTDGVYYSATRTNFTKLNQEPYPGVDSVVINPYRTSQVWVCMFGNGIRKGDSGVDSPSDLAIAAGSGHQFALSWTPVGGATGYQVQYTAGAVSWTGVVTWTTYASLSAGSNSANIDGLSDDSGYSFRVVCLNGSTTIGCSNIVWASIPGAPNLQVGSSGPSEVEIQWSDDHRFNSGYELQYSIDGVTWQNLKTISPANATNYSIGGLQPDTQYAFRLTAFNAMAQSAPSNTVLARTLGSTGLLAYEGFNYFPDPNKDNEILGQTGGFGWSGGWLYDQPDGSRDAVAGSLVGTNSAVGTNLLTTGNMFEAAGYGEISRNLATPASNATGTTLWLSFLLKTYNAVPIGYVELIDPSGAGDNLSVGFPYNHTFTIVIDDSDYWDTGIRPSVGDTHLLVMEITFKTWPQKDNVKLWIDPDPTASAPGTPALNKNASVDLPAFNAVNIMASWWYGYENDWDEIRLGTSYNAVVPMKLPASPSGLKVTVKSKSELDLAWADNSSNETGFHVERSTDQQTWTVVQTLGVNSGAWADTTVTPYVNYYYRVSACDATGDSVSSSIIKMTAAQLGDANLDRKVDGKDLAAWQIYYDPLGAHSATNTWAMGDWNGDGKIDGKDLALWQINYNPLGLAPAVESSPAAQDSQPSATTQSVAQTPAAQTAQGPEASPTPAPDENVVIELAVVIPEGTVAADEPPAIIIFPVSPTVPVVPPPAPETQSAHVNAPVADLSTPVALLIQLQPVLVPRESTGESESVPVEWITMDLSPSAPAVYGPVLKVPEQNAEDILSLAVLSDLLGK